MILFRPDAAVAGARRAMIVWCGSVAPALFPFLALMPLLTGPEACAAYNFLFSGVMNRVFRLPGHAAAAVVIGLIAGSPGGAMAIWGVHASAGFTKEEIRRLGCCICGVSPAFLIMGVGQGMYGSAKLGYILAIIQICIQLGALAVMRGKGSRRVLPCAGDAMQEKNMSIGRAVENVLSICGYMVLFSSVSAVITDLTGPAAGLAVLLMGDLPTGLANLAGMMVPGKMLMQGAAIGFGGLCIGMQNLDVLRPLGLGEKEYFAAKGIFAGMFGGICGVVLRGALPPEANYGGFAGNIYVVSLFTAAIFALPGMIYFSNKLFLNKRKLEEISTCALKNHNI